MSPAITHKRQSILAALREKKHVMTAVILRDMRTRFFNHGLGFLIVSLWPLAHMIILLGIYTVTGRRVPYGDSINVFFATGLIPTLLFTYVSRFMSLSLILNRSMLSFPVVSVIDIMVARAFLETIAAFLTLIFIFIFLIALGENPFPTDPYQAIYAYFTTLFLAVGIGFSAGVITMMMPFFSTIYALFSILIYLSSGTVFVTANLPDSISYALSWNPVLQTTEWMRTAYYPDYTSRWLDKEYILAWALGSLFLGLLLERILRGKMLDG